MTNATIGWLMVLVAGCLETFWMIGMKNSQGLTRWGWVAVMVLAMCASMGLLTLAVSKRFGLPIGTAYAVWTGMGAAGAAMLGMFLYKEPSEAPRLFFLTLVIVGIVGLKFSHREEIATAQAVVADATAAPPVATAAQIDGATPHDG